jgi:hypothetical protein
VRSKRGKDLASIDENDDGSLTSALSSSLHTLSSFFSQDHHQDQHLKEKRKDRKHKLPIVSSPVRTPPDSVSRGGVALTPLPNPLSQVEATPIVTMTPLSHLKPLEEYLISRVEKERDVPLRQVVDCETPRVITWTDLSYDPREYSHQSSSTKPILLKSLSIGKKAIVSHEEEEETGTGAPVLTSRSDESDYEVEWDRAHRNILRER